MKILMLLEAEFPPDERVEKEIAVLTQAGFSVTLAAYTFKVSTYIEHLDQYTVYRKRISKWLYKSSAASLVLPFYFWFWKSFARSILKAGGYRFIHVHDLPLSKVGYQLSRQFGLKLICDQHEYYSNWIVRTDHMNTFVGKIIRMLSNWSLYESKYLNRADMVITVEEPLREIYIREIGLNPGRIITVPNTPLGSLFHAGNINQAIKNRYKDHFVLFYAGSIDHIRGLEFVLQALALLKEEIPGILFVIAGKENKSYNLMNVADRYGVRNKIDFLGWIPRNNLPYYIAVSHVCISAPKADNLEVNNAIPTKVYQYALMGKPIIVSEARMMKEFVLTNSLGYSVNFGDVSALCNILKELYFKTETEGKPTDNAARIAREYSWEYTSKSLINYYLESVSQDVSKY